MRESFPMFCFSSVFYWGQEHGKMGTAEKNKNKLQLMRFCDFYYWDSPYGYYKHNSIPIGWEREKRMKMA